MDDDGNLTASEVTLALGRRLKLEVDSETSGPRKGRSGALKGRSGALLARREVERLHAACEEFLAR